MKDFNLKEIAETVVYEQSNSRNREEPTPSLWQIDLERALWILADCLPVDHHSDIVVTGRGVLILFHNIFIGTTDIDGYERFQKEFDDILLDGIYDTVQTAQLENLALPPDWFNNYMLECIQPNDLYNPDLMEKNLDEDLRYDYVNENGVNTLSLIPVTLGALLFSKFEARRDKDLRHARIICALMDLRSEEEIEDVFFEVCPEWADSYNYRAMHNTVHLFYVDWLNEYKRD